MTARPPIGQQRRQMSDATYQDAYDLAHKHSIWMRKLGPSHYEVWHGKWAIHVYPTTQHTVRGRGTPPTLDLPKEWSILSVILRVIETLEQKENS
jgi:hypothetical protein